MISNRRALLTGLSSVLALAGCRNEVKPSAAVPDSDQVQNALAALDESVDILQKSIGEFGTANWMDVVPHVRAAAADVNNAAIQLRNVLGFGDSAEPVVP